MSGAAQDDLLAVDDVVGEVRVHGRAHDRLARLQLREELQQPAHVVALGEPLAAHQAARFELRVRIQEPVGGDEVDARVVGPAHQQRLQDARDRALADRDAAREPDDVRRVRVELTEERLGHRLAARGSPRTGGSAAARAAGRRLRPPRARRDRCGRATQRGPSSSSVSGVAARSRLHCLRVKSTYAAISGSSSSSSTVLLPVGCTATRRGRRWGSSRRCRRGRSSPSGSWPGTAGGSPRRSRRSARRGSRS